MAVYSIVGASERDLHPTRAAAVVPLRIERKIDLEALAEVKGGPIEDGDVIQIMRIPKQSVILGAFVGVDKALSNDGATADVATASGTALAAGVAIGAAENGDIVAATTPAPVITNTDTDFINLTINGVTEGGTGVFRVTLEIMDLVAIRNPGIAQLGS